VSAVKKSKFRKKLLKATKTCRKAINNRIASILEPFRTVFRVILKTAGIYVSQIPVFSPFNLLMFLWNFIVIGSIIVELFIIPV